MSEFEVSYDIYVIDHHHMPIKDIGSGVEMVEADGEEDAKLIVEDKLSKEHGVGEGFVRADIEASIVKPAT